MSSETPPSITILIPVEDTLHIILKPSTLRFKNQLEPPFQLGIPTKIKRFS